jgi:hypothetical protein
MARLRGKKRARQANVTILHRVLLGDLGNLKVCG